MSGRYERKKPKKKGGKIVLIVLAVLLVLVLAIFGGVYVYYNSMLNKISRAEVVDRNPSDADLAGLIAPVEETEETEAETEPVIETTEETVPETKPMTADDIVNILVVGQAARPGEDARMADSTMLITINKYTKVLTMSSVLRDAFVKFPTFQGPDGRTHSGGRVKFTMTYASGYTIGDVGCAFQVADLVMQENFGVEVDYNFEVDFEMFIKFIDSMYGVEMEITEAEADYLNKELNKCGYEYEPGYTSLDGFSALTFARMRKAAGDSDSDIIRTGRQRYLVDRILNKMKWLLETKGLGAVQNICNEALPYVTTDMDNAEITKLMADMIPLLPELTIENGTIPVSGTGWGDYVDIFKDGFQHSVMRFDEGQNKKILRALTEGEVLETQPAS